jgi:RHS repeat-associated protein
VASATAGSRPAPTPTPVKTSQTYYHRNQQYSIVGLTNAAGTLVERYTYSAYGTLGIYAANGTVRSSSTYANRYTYTGREWDADLRLYHFRARWYDPVTGGFVSRDPLGYVDGMSLYRGYFGVRGADPDGLAQIRSVHELSPLERAPSSYVNLSTDNKPDETSENAFELNLLHLHLMLIRCCERSPKCPNGIPCEKEAEKVIEDLRKVRKQLLVKGVGYYFLNQYNCSECESHAASACGNASYFAYETVTHWSYRSHTWGQFRCRIDGEVFATIDLWADINRPCRAGRDGFPKWKGTNHEKIEEEWRQYCELWWKKGLTPCQLIPPVGQPTTTPYPPPYYPPYNGPGGMGPICFVAGTKVKSGDVTKSIENIAPGDYVDSFSLEESHWEMELVEAVEVSEFAGCLVVLSVSNGHSEITCTATHPFWVADAQDINMRPLPANRKAADENLRFGAKWVAAIDLRVGDQLSTRNGELIRITDIKRYEGQSRVYNLKIRKNRNYSIGKSGILVHNT